MHAGWAGRGGARRLFMSIYMYVCDKRCDAMLRMFDEVEIDVLVVMEMDSFSCVLFFSE